MNSIIFEMIDTMRNSASRMETLRRKVKRCGVTNHEFNGLLKINNADDFNKKLEDASKITAALDETLNNLEKIVRQEEHLCFSKNGKSKQKG